MDWINSWRGWIFVVSSGVLWGLPRVPYYHADLPYIHVLGGLALVAWYIGLGFLSLGLYIIASVCLRVGVVRVKSLHTIFLGGGAFILAGLFWWLYLLLLGMSVRLV